MSIDTALLLLLGLIFIIYKIHNKGVEKKEHFSWIDASWVFGKYYVLSFLLVFNTNVALSSSLTLYTASTTTEIGIINMAFASGILAFALAFFVGLFFWTK